MWVFQACSFNDHNQREKWWAQASFHSTQLNASLTSAWSPRMFINEYCRFSQHKASAIEPKWLTSTSLGHTLCTMLTYTRFGSIQNGCRPATLSVTHQRAKYSKFSWLLCTWISSWSWPMGNTLFLACVLRNVVSASNSPPSMSISRISINVCP